MAAHASVDIQSRRVPPRSRPVVKLLLVVATVCVFTYTYQYWRSKKDSTGNVHNTEISTPVVADPQTSGHDILQKKLKTEKGEFTYKQIFETYLKPHGYSLRQVATDSRQIFLPLYPPTQTCPNVFQGWIDVNNKPISNKPPRRIPSELKNDYLLNGHAKLLDWYFGGEANNAKAGTTLRWSKASFDRFADVIRNKQWKSVGYGVEGVSIYMAMKKYPPKGRGLVVGSLSPWVEGAAFFYGADSIVTAEYQPIASSHPKHKGVHPMEIAKHWETYKDLDFAASFSSIEHSGLGRYGDILDPWGDMKEVRKVYCLVKPGAIFYLGLPSFAGEVDQLAWNAHRVYGLIRWSMLSAGWKVLDVFWADSETPCDTTKPYLKGQVTVVLQKI